MNTKRYTFVIDTRQYSGNFERQMTAYCTGILGECEVGNSEATEFNDEYPLNPFENFIDMQMDTDDGALRPCCILPTPGRGNIAGRHRDIEDFSNDEKYYSAYESVGIFFYKKPTEELIKILKERSKKYAERNNITIVGYRLITETVMTESEPI